MSPISIRLRVAREGLNGAECCGVCLIRHPGPENLHLKWMFASNQPQTIRTRLADQIVKTGFDHLCSRSVPARLSICRFVQVAYIRQPEFLDLTESPKRTPATISELSP